MKNYKLYLYLNWFLKFSKFTVYHMKKLTNEEKEYGEKVLTAKFPNAEMFLRRNVPRRNVLRRKIKAPRGT